MASIIDTHTHLYLPEFDPSPDDAVRRAIEAGVTHMVFPNVDLTTVGPMRELHSRFPDRTYMAMGFHPTEVKEDWEEAVEKVSAELTSRRQDYVAVGEIGMDLYWDKTYRDEQMKALDRQVALARSLDLPVIIHCREALDETLEVLEDYRDIKGVFHSFGGTEKDVDRIRGRLNDDIYFGINGIVTFKNCKVRDVLPAITLSRLLLETDSPYLAPVPHRGKRNESAYLIHTAAYMADALQIPIDTLADTTSANARSLFGIK